MSKARKQLPPIILNKNPTPHDSALATPIEKDPTIVRMSSEFKDSTLKDVIENSSPLKDS